VTFWHQQLLSWRQLAPPSGLLVQLWDLRETPLIQRFLRDHEFAVAIIHRKVTAKIHSELIRPALRCPEPVLVNSSFFPHQCIHGFSQTRFPAPVLPAGLANMIIHVAAMVEHPSEISPRTPEDRLALQENTPLFFGCFPYVCPEPVLAK
jgi:hypothetical protein